MDAPCGERARSARRIADVGDDEYDALLRVISRRGQINYGGRRTVPAIRAFGFSNEWMWPINKERFQGIRSINVW